ncbi:MAG: Ldh family oxidoreductase [Clostridia bacterium]|nr:Ldh family oxidoreductase [Clostridia bacterium]
MNAGSVKRAQTVERLVAEGVPFEHAQTMADCLVTADDYGVTSHGCRMLDAHLDKIRRGGYNLAPTMSVLRETAAFAVIDGDNALGPVSAMRCMQYAMQKVKDSGVFTVFSRNNNTFGPAFYYSLKAAEQGYIAFVCSNSPAQMAPIGGKEKMLGTNPFAAVIPVPGGDPIMLDMATSVVAKSKFKEYKERSERLPEGWALDENGNPTTDPDEAMRGLVLPMAGFKGYGIAMLIDVIAGALSGAAYLNRVGRFYGEDGSHMNVGFCLTVIDPYAVLGEEYDAIVRDYIDTLRGSASAEGRAIALPGDDRMAYFHHNR